MTFPLRRPVRAVALVAAATTVLAGLVAAPAGAVGVVAAPRAVSAAAVARPAGAFVPLTPARVLDSRSGLGTTAGAVAPNRALHLTVAGRGGVPATGVSAVVLNLTVADGGAPGYLVGYATGRTAPKTSTLNWSAGQTVANQATVPVGTSGRIDLLVRSSAGARLVADVAGYYVGGSATADGTFTLTSPTRLLDTRAGVGAPRAKVRPGVPLDLWVVGHAGVPFDAAAVVTNITVTGGAKPGALTASAASVPTPGTSVVNWPAGGTVAAAATVGLGSNGHLKLLVRSSAPTDVLVDVTGYYRSGTATQPGTYVPVTPTRLVDTRRTGTPTPNVRLGVQVTGTSAVPATGVGAMTGTLTETGASSGGYAVVVPTRVPVRGPDTRPNPTTSSLNWSRGQTVANQVSLPLGFGGSVDLLEQGSTAADLVLDVTGYFLPTLPAAPSGVTATVDGDQVTVSWTPDAATADLTYGWMVVRTEGSVPASDPTGGLPTLVVAPTTSAVVDQVPPGASFTFTYAVFPLDVVFNAGPAAAVTLTAPTPCAQGVAACVAPGGSARH